MATRIGLLLGCRVGMGRRGGPVEEQSVGSVRPARAVGEGVVGAEHLPGALHGVPPGIVLTREIEPDRRRVDQRMFDLRGGNWAVAIRQNLSFAIRTSTSCRPGRATAGPSGC